MRTYFFTHRWVKEFGWENTIYQPEDFEEIVHVRKEGDSDIFIGRDINNNTYLLKGYYIEDEKKHPTLIPYGVSNEKSPTTLLTLAATYVQDCDNPAGNTHELNISVQDNGVGPYFVISTDRWAIEDWDELVSLVEDFKDRLL